MIWKPSHQTPLSAIAVTKIAQRVLEANGAPPIFNLVMGGRTGVGEQLVADQRVPLISATGSTRMGREVGKVLADRFGRALLELGGNNGIVVMDDADLDLALRAVLFAAVGTAGQRCTTTRRLFLHKGIAAEMKRRLVAAYGSIRIGDPAEAATLMGPLIDAAAVDGLHAMRSSRSQAQGGRVLYGGKVLDRPGFFVEPTLVEATPHMPITCEETFAPILYLFEFDDPRRGDRGPQRACRRVCRRRSSPSTCARPSASSSATGSDCGIANVNIGTSGAEIGGAFGGEKETGGGREAGSDSWKAYMRRQTCTLNWGDEPAAGAGRGVQGLTPRRAAIGLALLALALPLRAAEPAADRVFLSAAVYTVDAARSWPACH